MDVFRWYSQEVGPRARPSGWRLVICYAVGRKWARLLDYGTLEPIKLDRREWERDQRERAALPYAEAAERRSAMAQSIRARRKRWSAMGVGVAAAAREVEKGLRTAESTLL